MTDGRLGRTVDKLAGPQSRYRSVNDPTQDASCSARTTKLARVDSYISRNDERREVYELNAILNAM